MLPGAASYLDRDARGDLQPGRAAAYLVLGQ
jgi:hypothetical protein